MGDNHAWNGTWPAANRLDRDVVNPETRYLNQVKPGSNDLPVPCNTPGAKFQSKFDFKTRVEKTTSTAPRAMQSVRKS